MPNQSHSKCTYGTVYKVKTSKLENTKDYDSSRAFVLQNLEKENRLTSPPQLTTFTRFLHISFQNNLFFGLRLLLLQCGVWFLGELFLINVTNKFLSAAFPFESRYYAIITYLPTLPLSWESPSWSSNLPVSYPASRVSFRSSLISREEERRLCSRPARFISSML